MGSSLGIQRGRGQDGNNPDRKPRADVCPGEGGLGSTCLPGQGGGISVTSGYFQIRTFQTCTPSTQRGEGRRSGERGGGGGTLGQAPVSLAAKSPPSCPQCSGHRAQVISTSLFLKSASLHYCPGRGASRRPRAWSSRPPSRARQTDITGAAHGVGGAWGGVRRNGVGLEKAGLGSMCLLFTRGHSCQSRPSRPADL